MSEILIKAEHVSKKFSRSLKRSLWYGMKDVMHSLNPFVHDTEEESDAFKQKELRPGEFWALQDINFEVRRGECLGLIGHNGAGKSTLLKILNGLIRPDAGRVTMRGRIGAMIELGAGFNQILTGRENIYNQASLLGFSKQETKRKFDAIVEFSELEDFLDMPVQNYSSGMRVKLGFAVYSQLEPDILLIDEVLAVGDVSFRFKCLNAMGELQRRCALVFVTHSMPQVHRICSDLMLLSHGTSQYSGRDVSRGVRDYMQLVQGVNATVVGSGEANIVNLCVETRDGKATFGETARMIYGDYLRITATVEINTHRFSVLRMEFLLWNEEMMPVMEVMTQELLGHPFKYPASGQIAITAYVPRSELNAGRYSLSALVTDEAHTCILCNCTNAAYLRVEGDSPSGAHVISVANWTEHIETTGLAVATFEQEQNATN